jgi:hypothetical protein
MRLTDGLMQLIDYRQPSLQELSWQWGTYYELPDPNAEMINQPATNSARVLYASSLF